MQQLLLRRDSQPTSTSITVIDGGALPAEQQQQSASPYQNASDSLLHQTDKLPETVRGTKRKRSGIEIQILNEPILDFATKGLITVERAMSCFRA